MRTTLMIAIVAMIATFGLSAMACGVDSTSSEDAPSATSDKSETKAPKSFSKAPKVGTKAYCPVMKSEFTVTEKSARSEYKGRHYVFCCDGCKPQFDANPEKYI